MVNELFLLRPASAAAAHDFRQVVAYKDKLYKFLPKSKSLMNETYIMHVWNFKDKVWTNTEFTVPYDMRFVSMYQCYISHIYMYTKKKASFYLQRFQCGRTQ